MLKLRNPSVDWSIIPALGKLGQEDVSSRPASKETLSERGIQEGGGGKRERETETENRKGKEKGEDRRGGEGRGGKKRGGREREEEGRGGEGRGEERK
jgi:hypothetical protein